MMDAKEAVERLKELLPEGELKVVTDNCSQPGCTSSEDLRSGVVPRDQRLHDTSLYDLKDIRHQVLHTVTSLEELDTGYVIVGTDEGDWQRGKPESLLVRLTEWRTSPAE